jgi:hypothetical protein
MWSAAAWTWRFWPPMARPANPARKHLARLRLALGTAVAVVNLDYTLSLWRAGVARDLPVPGRVAMAVWAPAEDRLLLTVYPGTGRPIAQTTRRTTRSFCA